MKIYLFVILAAIALGCSTIFAQGDSSKCAIKAWVDDERELIKDIFVHESPSTTSKNIGEIPFVNEEGLEAIVEIVGYKNGWLQIRKATTLEDKVIFQGLGWIQGGRVTANVQRPDGNERKTAPLYSLHDPKSKKIGTIPSETLVKIVGFDCFGFKVKYKGKTGWLPKNYICGNPVTTCS